MKALSMLASVDGGHMTWIIPVIIIVVTIGVLYWIFFGRYSFEREKMDDELHDEVMRESRTRETDPTPQVRWSSDDEGEE